MLNAKRPCPPLEPLLTHIVSPGSVAYVNDSLFLHSVGCPPHVPAPGAVTLHLYAPPVSTLCWLLGFGFYSPDICTVRPTQRGDFSCIAWAVRRTCPLLAL